MWQRLVPEAQRGTSTTHEEEECLLGPLPGRYQGKPREEKPKSCSQMQREAKAAQEGDMNCTATFHSYAQAFHVRSDCLSSLSSFSARSFNSFPIHLPFLISPCFSVPSSPLPFHVCILLTMFHSFFTTLPKMSNEFSRNLSDPFAFLFNLFSDGSCVGSKIFRRKPLDLLRACCHEN